MQTRVYVLPSTSNFNVGALKFLGPLCLSSRVVMECGLRKNRKGAGSRLCGERDSKQGVGGSC